MALWVSAGKDRKKDRPKKDTALMKAQAKAITGCIHRVCVGGKGGMRFKK